MLYNDPNLSGQGLISNRSNSQARQIASLKPIAGKGIRLQRTNSGVIISATAETTVSGSAASGDTSGVPRWR
jgi:hypothetical protein